MNTYQDAEKVVRVIERSLRWQDGYVCEIMRDNTVVVSDSELGTFSTILRGTDSEVSWIVGMMRRPTK